MRKKCRHIALFVFSSSIAIPLLLMVLLQGWQLCLKQSAAHRLHSPLQTVVLPVHKVHWEKKEKELVIDGRFFDIQSYSVKDGQFTATGVFDEHETALVKFLNHHFNHSKQSRSLIQLLFIGQCFAALVFLLFHFFTIPPALLSNSFFKLWMPFPYFTINTPPPRSPFYQPHLF